MFRYCFTALAGFGLGAAYVDLTTTPSLKFPKLSTGDKCHVSTLYRNRMHNYLQLNGENITLTDNDRIKIANDCIDFKFTPVTTIIKEYVSDDGSIYSHKRCILPDDTVIVDHNHLVHVNKLSLQILGIEDCVNNCNNPSEAKKECLTKIIMSPKFTPASAIINNCFTQIVKPSK